MGASPWLVSVTALRKSIGNRRSEVRDGTAASLGRVELKVGDTVVPPDAEVEAAADLDSLDGGIEVSGTVRTTWVGECRRCLRPVSGPLEAAVREVYRPRPAGGESSDDDETYPFSGELLDLAPLVRDAILLELPIAPLCRDECAGLCPTCGAVLDDGPCGCPPAAGDPRWAALDALRATSDAPDGTPGD